MKEKKYLLIAILTSLLFTGCQSNDLTAENNSLKQQITELEHHITQLEQEISDMKQSVASSEEDSSETSVPANNLSQNTETTYTLNELSAMVDEFIASVGSATPDVNNSGNLDPFFSLKREGDQLEHALENYENSLEDQYRSGTLSREDFRKSDKEIEKLEESLDSAIDRLEIAFGIDD